MNRKSLRVIKFYTPTVRLIQSCFVQSWGFRGLWFPAWMNRRLEPLQPPLPPETRNQVQLIRGQTETDNQRVLLLQKPSQPQQRAWMADCIMAAAEDCGRDAAVYVRDRDLGLLQDLCASRSGGWPGMGCHGCARSRVVTGTIWSHTVESCMGACGLLMDGAAKRSGASSLHWDDLITQVANNTRVCEMPLLPLLLVATWVEIDL